VRCVGPVVTARQPTGAVRTRGGTRARGCGRPAAGAALRRA